MLYYISYNYKRKYEIVNPIIYIFSEGVSNYYLIYLLQLLCYQIFRAIFESQLNEYCLLHLRQNFETPRRLIAKK